MSAFVRKAERERERQRETKRKRERERERESYAYRSLRNEYNTVGLKNSLNYYLFKSQCI